MKIEQLATKIDKEYKEIRKNMEINMSISYLNTKILNAVHDYCVKDLQLKEHHPWNYVYDMNEDTGGVYETNGGYININCNEISPVDYLFAALDTDDKKLANNYYKGAYYCMSVMCHELRHAYQHENGQISNDMKYISSNEDYEGYKQQWCETDAREYQQRCISEELINYIYNNL